MKTPQFLLNEIVLAMYRQNAPAMITPPDGQPYCVYRTEATPKHPSLTCAVGCLIPADRYDPKLEENSVGTATLHNFLLTLDIDTNDPTTYELLRKAQSIHDNYHPSDTDLEFRDYFIERITPIALQLSLLMPTITNATANNQPDSSHD